MLFGSKEPAKPVQKKTVQAEAAKTVDVSNLAHTSYDVLIGKNTVINGNISVQGCTRIDGYIEGTLAVDNMLHVGEAGVIKAPVFAQNAIIAGTVFGNIVVKGRLQLTPTAKVTGNLKCGSLSIPDGAYFRGVSSGFDDGGELPAGSPKADVKTAEVTEETEA